MLAPRKEDIPCIERVKKFLRTCWRGIVAFVVPLILIPTMLPFPAEKYQIVAYTLYVMAIYWVTECIPLAVTALIPIIIFPLTGVMSTEHTISCYMNDTILMFLGSLILASAVEQSGLHTRVALLVIKKIGCSHKRLLFAMSLVTMFVSMWITNTAATTMMVPITFAILKVFEEQKLMKIYDTDTHGDPIASDLTTCYFCSLTYSATIGGIGTLVGTVTNLVFKGLFIGTYPLAPEYLSFPKFSSFSVIYMIIMELLLYFNMIVQYFGYLRPKSKAAKAAHISPQGLTAAKKEVDQLYKALGPLSFWEAMVLMLFGLAIALFFCRSPTIFEGWADEIRTHFLIENPKFILDSAAAALVAFLMFFLPSSMAAMRNMKATATDQLTTSPVSSILRWSQVNAEIPFSYFFLLGGGFALAKAASSKYSNLNGRIGDMLISLRVLPNYFILFLVIITTVFITNFTSNVCVCNVITPIAMKLAEEIYVHPLWYNLASGLSASYAFLLPVGTPGNLIVQSAAKIPTTKMIIAGIGPTIMAIFITWLAICFWAPVIWPHLRYSFSFFQNLFN